MISYRVVFRLHKLGVINASYSWVTACLAHFQLVLYVDDIFVDFPMFKKLLLPFIAFSLSHSLSLTAEESVPVAVSSLAQSTADYASATYQQAMTESLAQLVSFNTVAVEGLPSPENPVHQGFKQELARQADQLGLDFSDYGYVVVIGLGQSDERLGLITHGDVQPADPSKWLKSPFELDATSEPGILLARGAEDDKGPISTAMYAMKAIKDKEISLKRRIELYVYMAEESDWAPLEAFVKTHPMPQLNITIDANYPVVTAEKGYGTVKMTFSNKVLNSDKPYIKSFSGGFFTSQIPEDAQAIIAHANSNLLKKIITQAAKQKGMKYSYDWHEDELMITALGKSTHSSEPQHGKNAIAHLAALLSDRHWPNNASGALVNFINTHLGTGIYGELFGKIAFKDAFMGPMTVAPTVLTQKDHGIELSINLRQPRGKTLEQLTEEINQTLIQWQQKNQVNLLNIDVDISEPFVQTDAPQVPTLLAVFAHYTGIKDAQPISIGAGTNSRLFPTAVVFGPAMPGKPYTGHSEHEFVSVEQFVLNLKMYTAAMVELAGEP